MHSFLVWESSSKVRELSGLSHQPKELSKHALLCPVCMLPTTASSLTQLLQDLPSGIQPQEGIRKIMWKLDIRGEYF